MRAIEIFRRMILYAAFFFKGTLSWYLMRLLSSLVIPLFYVTLMYSGAVAFGGFLELRGALLLFIIASLVSLANTVSQLIGYSLQGYGADFDAALLGDARLGVPSRILTQIPFYIPALIAAVIAGGIWLLALTLLALYFTASLGAFVGAKLKDGFKASHIMLVVQLALLVSAPIYLRSEGLWILIPLSVLNPATPLQILYTFLLSTVLFVASLREIAR